MLRRRSCQLRPRPAGTPDSCTAQTCYASFSVDLWMLHGYKNMPGCYASFNVDLWLLHECKNRSGQILNLHTHRYAQSTRKISWTDVPRVYYNAQVIYVSGSRVCSCSSRRLPAVSRILSLHTLPSRQQGTWKLSWTDYASRRNHAQAISVVSYRHNRERHSLRRTNNLHNPIRRPKSTPTNYAPECFTQTVAYRKCSREPR